MGGGTGELNEERDLTVGPQPSYNQSEHIMKRAMLLLACPTRTAPFTFWRMRW